MSRGTVWEDVDVRLYLDGEEMGFYFCTSLGIEDQINVDKAQHQGSSTPDIDGTYDGATGSFEFRIKAGYADPRKVFEAQLEHIKNRTPGGVIRAVVSREKPDGSGREALRIGPLIAQHSDRAGSDQPWTASWRFDAEEIKPIAA